MKLSIFQILGYGKTIGVVKSIKRLSQYEAKQEVKGFFREKKDMEKISRGYQKIKFGGIL